MSTNAITNAAHNVAQPTVVMPPAGKEQNNVSVLYNAMVAPFNKLSVRAALWYQGEVSRLIDDSSTAVFGRHPRKGISKVPPSVFRSGLVAS